MKTKTITIGQRIAAAVVAHQLDISSDRALKLYVQGCEIDPSWERAGEELLKSSLESAGTQGSLPPRSRPHVVRPKIVNERD
jgi:hypothetical protein